MNSEIKVYLLEHVRDEDGGLGNLKTIGIYSTLELAQMAIIRSSKLPGFCDYINNFTISPKVLDMDYWQSGFD